MGDGNPNGAEVPSSVQGQSSGRSLRARSPQKLKTEHVNSAGNQLIVIEQTFSLFWACRTHQICTHIASWRFVDFETGIAQCSTH